MEKHDGLIRRFTKKSIKTKSIYLFIPVIAIPIVLGIVLILCFGKYFRHLDYANTVSYNLIKVDNSLNKVDEYFDSYFESGMDSDKEAALTYIHEADTAVNSLYSNGSQYNDASLQLMQSLNKIFDDYSSSVNKILSDNDYINAESLYKDQSLQTSLNTMRDYINSITDEELQYSNNTLDDTRFDTNVLKIVIGLLYFIIIVITILTVLYIRKHIVNFVSDISDQTRLLNQGYYDMQDIYAPSDDEMGKLAEVFNSVKNQLKEVKRINFENQEILRKLKAEEINKESFVKKLYDEKKEKENITEKAQKDGLTGLYNRRTFENLVDEYLVKKPGNKSGALFIMDMDYFKSVNDTLGHLGGDEALKYMSGALRIVFAGNAYVGRWGGDEFTAFMTDINGVEDVEKAARDLCSRMNVTLDYNDIKKDISISVGAAMTPGVESMSELYLRADKALYHVKNSGRNNYAVYENLPDEEKEI